MKICILANSLNVKSGGGRFVYEIVQHLKRNINIDVVVLTTSNSNLPFEKSILYPNKIKLFLSLLNIRKIIKSCDIVHSFDVFPYGLIAAITSIGLGKKKIITAVGSGSVKPLYKIRFLFFVRWAYKSADIITAISSYTKREVLKKISDIEIQIIMPGINYEYFSKLLSITGKLKSDHVNYPYILSVGALKPRKGYHLSLLIFSKISKLIPGLRYIIVGSGRGGYYEKLNSIIKNLNIEDKVIFKEGIPDTELVFLYKNANLFILLPHNVDYDIEGFGLVFLEAAFFGCPSVGSLNSGAEDAITINKSGILIDNADDIDNLVREVYNLIIDNKFRDNLKEKLRELIKDKEWNIVINKYIKIYELLLR